MTKRILFILLAVFFGMRLQAQTDEKDGTTYVAAVPVVPGIGETKFTDVRDTENGPPWYYNYLYKTEGSDAYQRTQGRAVYYRLEMPMTGDVIIHNWNSLLGYSTIFVERLISEDHPESGIITEDVARFNEGDFLSPDFHPEDLGLPEYVSPGLAYLHLRNLPAGTYLIITAGYKYTNASQPNGKLRTNIIADLSPGIPDEPELMPEQPNNCPVQYRYDASGNRIKSLKKQ